MSITVACTIWGKNFRGNTILVFCDNTTSVTVLNSGHTKDEFLIKFPREICYISSLFEFSVKAKHIEHIEGTYNRTADLLSRWKQTSNPLTKLKAMVNDQLIEHVEHMGNTVFSTNEFSHVSICFIISTNNTKIKFSSWYLRFNDISPAVNSLLRELLVILQTSNLIHSCYYKKTCVFVQLTNQVSP